MIDHPSALSIALSGGFIILAGLLGTLALRDVGHLRPGRLLALLAFSLMMLELASGPVAAILPDISIRLLALPASANVALLWWFCLAELRDDVRPDAEHWVVAVLLCVGPFTAINGWDVPEAIGIMISLAPFCVLAHIAWVALAGRRSDLVERRWKLRAWLPLLLAGAALISLLSELLADHDLATLIRLGAAGLPGELLMLFWLVRLDPGRLAFEDPLPQSERPKPTIDPRDLDLLDRLNASMAAGAWRDPDLSIDRLADRLGVPVHRLRALINRGLGQRNFASFVNAWRLDHAKAALADPARGRETVLAIAFESGFGALQSFNRVFRDSTGETPTAYRQRCLTIAAQARKTPPKSEKEQ